MKLRTVLNCLASLLLAASAQAQTATLPQPAKTPITKLTLHPVAATQPWMQYRLIPDALEQRPGNAVPFYLMTRRGWPDQQTTHDVLQPANHQYDYLDTPIDKFPKQYAQRLLVAYADTLQYAELGAQRRDADWEGIWDIEPPRPNLIGQGRFNYLDDLRHVENLLSFRSRFEMSQNDWPAAHHTVQTMLTLARHMGSERLLIHKLVEAGFTEITLAVSLEEWVGRDSPNLYWPLTNLPRPFIPAQTNGYYDDLAARTWRPFIAQAMAGKIADDAWPRVIQEIIEAYQDSHPPHQRHPDTLAADMKQLVDSKLAAAQASLRAAGSTEAQIAAMSPEHVVGASLIREYANASDGLWKYFNLPFPIASAQMLQFWREIAPQKSPARDNPLIQEDLLDTPTDYRIPRVLRTRYQFERADRYIALLRTIEALRDYAAHHDGSPPLHLSDITALPVPNDPMTGQEFPYTLTGNVAILDATPPPPFGVYGGWRYELTFVK